MSNANGSIIPPQPGALGSAGFPTPVNANPIAGVQQATNNSIWLIHTADNGTRGNYVAFISRTTRDRNYWSSITPTDFELRLLKPVVGLLTDNTELCLFRYLLNYRILVSTHQTIQVMTIGWFHGRWMTILVGHSNGCTTHKSNIGTYDHTVSTN